MLMIPVDMMPTKYFSACFMSIFNIKTLFKLTSFSIGTALTLSSHISLPLCSDQMNHANVLSIFIINIFNQSTMITRYFGDYTNVWNLCIKCLTRLSQSKSKSSRQEMYNGYALFMLQTKFFVTPDIYDDSNGKVLEDWPLFKTPKYRMTTHLPTNLVFHGTCCI